MQFRSHAIQVQISALLKQEITLLRIIESDKMYQFQCPIVKSSIGQHMRHVLDHLQKPLEFSDVRYPISYDVRTRDTPVERSKSACLALIENLEKRVSLIGKSSF